ncbi:DEAD/DEAH box helicase domain protein [Lentisphaera araneosa HTCC2155]|uniref:DEAD/DEAH box helicase domain protein n=1 Tax=Lentisphaera araneosa HTCC2155 TaxID=313628 RepID=A6DQ79_9BACT|nr:DEAD/DEAH box helicase [Lentisphaera araneosa]EDM26130.1 DEAD/DEAH box helicase domain protein [Lentisphaera araneosa HTCC2155]
MKLSFQEKILQRSSFLDQYKSLLISSAIEEFPLSNTDGYCENAVDVDWHNMLFFASALSKSEHHEHCEKALRICQVCLGSSQVQPEHKYAAAIILCELSNSMTLELAYQRDLLSRDFESNLSAVHKMNLCKSKIKFSICDSAQKILSVNRFQKDVYENYMANQCLSISAPTSAGKSYILKKVIIDLITQETNNYTIVYVVPTRALISQVEQEMKELLQENLIIDGYVSSIPNAPEGGNRFSKYVYVFTQERLHWFRSSNTNVLIDCLIVDEAHKIDDGSRGLLLQEKIEELITDHPDIRILFSSPFTSNPEVLYKGLLPTDQCKPIKTDFVAVNQNLFYLRSVYRKPRKWILSLVNKNDQVDLGEVLYDSRPDTEIKKIGFAVNYFGKNGGNLVYVNTADVAEKEAILLSELYTENIIDQEVNDLIDLCSNVIHKKYTLMKALNKGIAFHYGSMPMLIRSEIERLFELGKIHTLICTSTLLEGVNLPAKNIFIRKPSRGVGKPLSASDFWNLAGRAGRLGKEFQGNIFCIDPDTWVEKVPLEREKNIIARAVDKLEEKSVKDEIHFYIEQSLTSKYPFDFKAEAAFSYFYLKRLNGRLDAINIAFFKDVFQRVDELITLPRKHLVNHPGISPIGQQRLLQYFINYDKNITDLIPAYPEEEDALENYIKIVTRISKFLSGDNEAIAFYHALLIVNWLRGMPLSYIIKKNQTYWTKKDPKKSLATVIRKSMRDIETVVRFKFVKFISCYVDVLQIAFQQKGINEPIDELNNFKIWLELGVSQTTQINLINLGLSRHTAIELSKLLPKDDMSLTDVKKWMLDQDLETLNFSSIYIREIELVRKDFHI